jgi:hypothetical protein
MQFISITETIRVLATGVARKVMAVLVAIQHEIRLAVAAQRSSNSCTGNILGY